MKAGSTAARATAARTKAGGKAPGNGRKSAPVPAVRSSSEAARPVKKALPKSLVPKAAAPAADDAAPDPASSTPERTLVNTPHYLRSRMGKVCVAIMAATPAEMMEKAEAVVRDNSFIEFRLDYLPNPAAVLPELK